MLFENVYDLKYTIIRLCKLVFINVKVITKVIDRRATRMQHVNLRDALKVTFPTISQ